MKRAMLLLLLVAHPLAAQSLPPTADVPAQRTVWAEGGLSLMTGPYGLGANAGLTTRRGSRSFRLGLHNAENIKATLTSRAVSLSVGSHRTAGPLHFDLFAGPALVWGEDGINAEGFAVGGESYRTVGLITDVSALVALGSHVRLGVGTWANVNAKQSTIGAGPRLQIRVF